MSGSQRIFRPKNIVAYYRAEALRCREEARRERFFQRRYELEARAEHLEEIIEELR